MHSWKRSLTLLAGGIVLSTSGCDLSDLIFAGNPVPTAVSGTTTSDVHTLSVAGGKYGVESIDWAEGGVTGGLDRPCFLQVTFRSLADEVLNPATENTVQKSVNVCNAGSYTNVSLESVDLRFAKESYATGNVDDWHLFANSVQTCDSSQTSNDRIKGIAIWGVAQNAAVVPTATDYKCTSSAGGATISGPCRDEEVHRDIATQKNCGTWSPLVTCPAGQIASGVNVHVDGNEIVGLGLQCDTVISNPSTP